MPLHLDIFIDVCCRHNYIYISVSESCILNASFIKVMEVKRYLVLLVCFVEATVLAGALYGWPSLVYVLEVRLQKH